MNLPLLSVARRIAVFFLVIQVVSGCSGSSADDPTVVGEVTNMTNTEGSSSVSAELETEAVNTGDQGPAMESAEVIAQGDALSDAATDSESGGTATDGESDEPEQETGEDIASTDPAITDPVVPDPLIQNTTQVTFDIQVPAYQSNALQVSVMLGDTTLNAGWVGDEFWSATAEFPTDTALPLNIVFYDDNGATPLASIEQEVVTGSNASFTIRITADDFDTGRWDSDGDGISNLEELLMSGDMAASVRVLLFSETRGFRHPSIETALDALEEITSATGIATDRAGDSSGVFTTANLASYDAVVWVLTSGDVLDENEQAAFESYIQTGGGFAGIHAASDTEYDWPWYGDLVGAYFERHPVIQSATQIVEDGSHPSTAHLDLTWTRTDEWYDYRTNPRARVNVLLRLDETTYNDGGMGDDHPSAWYHEYDGGRSWYTGGGHTAESYAEPDFREHLLGGLRYAVGQ